MPAEALGDSWETLTNHGNIASAAVFDVLRRVAEKSPADAAAGIIAGTAMAFASNLTPTFPLVVGGFTFPGYTALYTLVLNLVVAIVLTPAFNAVRRSDPVDATAPADYHA